MNYDKIKYDSFTDELKKIAFINPLAPFERLMGRPSKLLRGYKTLDKVKRVEEIYGPNGELLNKGRDEEDEVKKRNQYIMNHYVG